MAEVFDKRLAGHQMDRNGIAGKRVHGQDIVTLWRLAFERQARVAQQRSEVPLAIVEEGELSARDRLHLGIDLIITIEILGAAVTRTHARAQSDDPDALMNAGFGERLSEAEARGPDVVAGGFIAKARVEHLRAVLDGSVQKRSGL